jgi:hypothetical protein
MKKENHPKTNKLQTAKKTAAVLAMLSSPTIEGAAKAAGISRATLFLWLKEDAFRDELARARAETFAGAIGSLKAGTERAARVLLELLESKKETTRRHASIAVLDFALRIHEGEELDERLRRLEEIAGTGIAGGRLFKIHYEKSMDEYRGRNPGEGETQEKP